MWPLTLPWWVALLAVLYGVGGVYGQSSPGLVSENPTSSDWHFRYDLFQMLLEERGLEVLSDVQQAFSNPVASVIVISGTPPQQFSDPEWAAVVRFVRQGGALLLASDGTFSAPGLGHFLAGPVTTAQGDQQYQGFADCLQLPMTSEGGSLFAGVSQVVTNRAGCFIPDSAAWLNWETMVSLPPDCQPVNCRQQPLLALGRSPVSSVGRVLVAADASLFSNGMLWHGDNAIAAIRASELLLDPAKEQVVFIADGQVRASYREQVENAAASSPTTPSPKRRPPEPELDKALRLANAITQEIAASNIFNEALRQQPRTPPPARYFRALLVMIATLSLLAMAWMLLTNGTQRGQFLAPRQMCLAYEMRGSMGSDPGDYRQSAAHLAREFCFEVTGSRQSADWQQYTARRPDTFSRLSAVEQQILRKTIDVACRGCQTRLSREEFLRWGESLRALRRVCCT
ncbi:MAG: hypothetical protein KDA45_04640 [Planctomycetales bacterium]|nr:hypothetical protein [Planctomycetales bacterium]